ncbi:MAG TPA: carbon starvation protein A [Pirellulaceae bacterium]|nr:carbon starvation protein A [Pirellulaceae bacterium]
MFIVNLETSANAQHPMETLSVALGAGLLFLVAYHTYGRWLARRVFELRGDTLTPSEALRDDVDFVPTKRSVVFGHHFTSIAGTGPIVGPAIAVFWGWLPALLWIVLGSILIGAVHDFGALVLSLRNKGQTVGEIAASVISPRARILFLSILFFALLIVLAVFGLVIATIFAAYPGSVLPVWLSLPMAMLVGYLSHRRGWSIGWMSLISLALLYVAVYVGAYHLPIQLPAEWNPVIVWTMVLLVYCFFASVWPVWLLLQPRDYINSHQLITSMGLLLVGLVIASWQGASLAESAPAIVAASELPRGAPPIFPFLFIYIACGACSGFHCLVSSGTTSKQLSREIDAQYVGYGAMLLEGMLAVVVVLACCAGVGMGRIEPVADTSGIVSYQRVELTDEQGTPHNAAWRTYYDTRGEWDRFGLRQSVGAFVDGGANFLSALGIPLPMGVGIIAVLVACFAATTLDSATRLQRYVIQELSSAVHIKPLTNKYAATLLAVVLSAAISCLPGKNPVTGVSELGRGGMILWPLFGTVNQLLAGLAILVLVIYLLRHRRPTWFLFIPLAVMTVIPGWALIMNLFASSGFIAKGNWLLASVSFGVGLLLLWIAFEAFLTWRRLQKGDTQVHHVKEGV